MLTDSAQTGGSKMTNKHIVTFYSIFLVFGGPYTSLARVNPYTWKDDKNRTIFCRATLLLAATAMLSACGGGSGSGSGGGGGGGITAEECVTLPVFGVLAPVCFSVPSPPPPASLPSLPSPAPTAPGQQDPSVTSVLPVDGATAVPLNNFVQVEFSERVDVNTVVMSVVRNGLLDFSDAFKTAFWARDCHNTGNFCRVLGWSQTEIVGNQSFWVNFAPNSTYTLTIAAGVESQSGTPLPADFSWSFTTGTACQPEAGMQAHECR